MSLPLARYLQMSAALKIYLQRPLGNANHRSSHANFQRQRDQLHHRYAVGIGHGEQRRIYDKHDWWQQYCNDRHQHQQYIR